MNRIAPRLIIPTLAIAAIVMLASCSDDSDSNDGKTPSAADLYATQTAESSSSVATPATGATQPAETPAQPFAEACQRSDEKQWSSPPPRIIDTAKTYVATIKTDKGDIVLELFSDTPITTNNFVFLACKGFYDGLTFHRVVPNFVIQSGRSGATASGGPGYTIPDESDSGHTMGIGSISFAKTIPDSAGSQFFVATGLGNGGSLAYLDPDFTVFGEVISGQDIAGQIQQGDTINTITITEQ